MTGKKNPNYKHGLCGKDRISYIKMWQTNNKDRTRAANRRWYQKNREYDLQRNKSFLLNHPGYLNNNYHKRMKHDIVFRIKCCLRARLRSALKYNLKSGSAISALGCSVDKFKKYLESRWLDGMNWNNYGKRGWHIDHIKPLASFDLSDPEEQKKSFHYTNLQPLWAIDNYRKNKKWEE